ncbi:MAG: nucleotidyltransferase domain-containing protein [Planctomycetota bacterium]|nr:MAG: nucleotidyltransferase domain-containing protein [Planctomycetota bacterium]
MSSISPHFDVVLQEAVSRLREAFSPVAIYLFGSYAYGAPGAGSDLDLLVVVEDSASDPYTRDALAYRVLSDLAMPKDVQVYTRSEFERRAALPVSFERTVETKGALLYVA